MKTILIVDDHADIRRLVRLTLEFEDCTIFEAPDAATGWELAHSIRPALILLDVMMPGGQNGLDLCHAIKGHPKLAEVPVVILSARGASADREAGLAAGANAYLVKPFSPMQLLELLQQLTGDRAPQSPAWNA